MSLANKLIRGSALSILEQTVKIAAIFITTPLMVHQLGEEQYGLWIVALAIIAYLHLLDLGVSFSGTRFLGQAIGSGDPARYRETVHTLNYLFARIALAAVLTSLALAFLVPLWLPADAVLIEVRWLILALGLATSLRFVTRIYEVILKSHVRYDLIGLIAIFKTVIQSSCLIYFLSRGHGLKTLLAIFILTDLADQALLRFFARKVEPGNGISLVWKRPSELAPFLRYSVSAMMANLGHQLRNGVDPVIIGHFSGIQQVPVYSIGARFLSLFTDVINAIFGGNFVAAFSQLDGRNDQEGLRRNFLKTTSFSSAFATIGGMGIAIFGPPFIERWIGPSFAESGRVLIILTAPTCMMLAQYPVWSFFYSQNKQHWLAIACLTGGAFNAILSIILVIKVGFLGVVYATAAELLLLFGLYVPWLVSRNCECGFFRFWAHLLRHSLPYLILGTLFASLLGGYLEPDYLSLSLLGALYGAVSLPLLLIATFTMAERRLLLSRICPWIYRTG